MRILLVDTMNMRNSFRILLVAFSLALAAVFFVLPAFHASAQLGSSATSTASTSSPRATSAVAVPPQLDSGQAGQARATTSVPTFTTPKPLGEGGPRPTSAAPPPEHSNILENVGMSSGTAVASTTERTDNSTMGTVLAVIASVLGAGALFAGAYSMLRGKAKQDKQGESRCFDIKKLMEEKLKELTNLRGQLESKAKETARGVVRDAVKGTAAGEMLIVIEHVEKECARLKQLYEKCIVEFGAAKKLYIMCGLAFAGKSTLARTVAERTKSKLIAFDKLWIEKDKEKSIPKNAEGWRYIRDVAQEEILTALREGSSVVYDDNNPRKEHRDELRDIAKKAGADLIVIYLDTPLDTIRAREKANKISAERHSVEPKNFEKVLADFQNPTTDEKPVIYTPETDIDSFLKRLDN